MFTKVFKITILLLFILFNASQSIHSAENAWSVEQDVINFTISYSGFPNVNSSTVLANIGITDTVEFIMELENSVHLTYQSGDAAGIVTVGDAIALIQSKL